MGKFLSLYVTEPGAGGTVLNVGQKDHPKCHGVRRISITIIKYILNVINSPTPFSNTLI